ncbi:MAG: capsular polysaccharide biosynthesis protein [Moraxella sp.]|nr:capsular polysaccharide biosynthesis protein [Moraxella sp.]
MKKEALPPSLPSLTDGKLLHRLGIDALLCTAGILKNNALLGQTLGVSTEPLGDTDTDNGRTAIAGWGRKPSFARAKAAASRLDLPLITLEDGFIRSIDSGTDSRYALSYIADDLGVYFDLSAPSRLEYDIIHRMATWQEKDHDTVCPLIKKILKHRLSKYNHTSVAPDLSATAGNDRPHVLIIDQVENDASITGAGADKDHFFAMLEQAKKTYPTHNLWVKAHPAGRGYFKKETLPEGIFFLADACNPIALITQADALYTVSSHMGFEGLLLKKTVHCFGVAWYSGFGLTDDSHAPKALLDSVKTRRQALWQIKKTTALPSATVLQLFYAAYLDYSYYADPASMGIIYHGRCQTPCTLDTALDYLIRNKQHAQSFHGVFLAYHFSRWKSPFVRAFLETPLTNLTLKPRSPWLGAMPLFVQEKLKNPKTPYQKKDYTAIIAWGLTQKTELAGRPAYQDTPIFCMEDGFIRSHGLGATLLPPLSVVVDRLGIYYNAKTPSTLETLLATTTLDAEEEAHATALAERLIALKVSKYNVGKPARLDAALAVLRQKSPTAKIRLVVGQVEDDASVQNCLSEIKKNSDLLADVRRRHPDDIIIYKPHPDVEAGLRQGVVENDVLACADLVACDTAIDDCLALCDVLHTISSLSGFEALIRGKAVVCYGLPFYAGFGLTDDIESDSPAYQAAKARRNRKTPLTLPMLIHATLIAYPLYRLPDGVGIASAMQVVEYLAHKKTTGDDALKNPTERPKHQGLKKRFMQLRNRHLSNKS